MNNWSRELSELSLVRWLLVDAKKILDNQQLQILEGFRTFFFITDSFQIGTFALFRIYFLTRQFDKTFFGSAKILHLLTHSNSSTPPFRLFVITGYPCPSPPVQ
jgi:hypothetical protein